MKPEGEKFSILLRFVLLSVVLYSTSILFGLDECQKFFSVSHVGAAILVFSVRFGAAFDCFTFFFCSTIYVRPLSHLSLLGFVTFVISTFLCNLFSYFVLTVFPQQLVRFLMASFIPFT